MFRSARNLVRLLVIARTLARHDALRPLQQALSGSGLAPAALAAGGIFAVGRMRSRPGAPRPGERLAAALSELGPAFIKLGQMLSTRSDLMGEQMAADLSRLQDRLAPFPSKAARATVEAELGRPIDELFLSFEDRPVSAASIAQVHYATVPGEAPDEVVPVAVKVLRPGIEQAFARDLELMLWLAELIERTQPKLRRLRPVEVVHTFANTVAIEMDLRLEAAAASELAENFVGDPTYRVPAIDWRRTAQRVMTQQRLSGIPMGDRAGLLAAGLDVDAVLEKAATIFFKQVFRDGYFHGDQHPGNMFVDAEGNIGAVDFGIMGRLDRKTRYYLADMLLAFLERDYRRVAEIHIALGYVPASQSVAEFAQACRAIGEPIFGRPLAEISFARVLGQLFRLAETFDMQAQPQLMLLQKNMVMAEGVSRQLNPTLNIWTLAQPLIEDWMRENRGPEARLRDAVVEAARALERLPRFMTDLEQAVGMIAREGVRLHRDTMQVYERVSDIRRRLPVWLAIGAVILLILLLR
jgi:ubiquinone biosynthesis protein